MKRGEFMSKLFHKLNVYFLHDEEEQAPVSDYLWFYGFNGGFILISFFMFIKLITF